MTTDKNPSSIPMKVIVPLILLLIGVMGLSAFSGFTAAAAATKAVTAAGDAKTLLSIHEAKQNGTLETIDHKLGDLEKQIDKVDKNQTVRIDKLETTIIQLLTESGP